MRYFGLIVLLLVPSLARGALVYSTAGATLTQDFNSLPQSGSGNSWTNDSTLSGWSLFRQPAPGTAITTFNAGIGSDNAGNFYSYGSAGTPGDRALGGLGSGGAYFGSPASGAIAGWMAVQITNNTGSLLDTFTVTYDGEQWRDGGNTTAQTMEVEFGFGNTFTGIGTWTAIAALNFTSPIATATASALDGNNALNRLANITSTLPGQTWADGQSLWLRWVERNDTGNDHGLAVDNFRFSATGAAAVVPEPSSAMLLALGVLCGCFAWCRQVIARVATRRRHAPLPRAVASRRCLAAR